MADKQIFDTLLERHASSEATLVKIPFDVEKVFGAKRVPVKVSINGAEHRSTLARRSGEYLLVIPKHFREAAGISAGETITVELERDTEPRIIEPTPDLADALGKNPSAKASWEKLSYTHKKEFVAVLEEARREETRARRVEKIIEELLTKYNKK